MSALGLIKINIALTAFAYYKELRTTFNKECTFFYCCFSTAILLKVVVAKENEINNVFLWSFKTEFRTKWTLWSFKKMLIVNSVRGHTTKNICSKIHLNLSSIKKDYAVCTHIYIHPSIHLFIHPFSDVDICMIKDLFFLDVCLT